MASLARSARRFAKRFIDGKPIQGRELQLRTETLLIYSLATGGKAKSENLPDELSRYASMITERCESVASFEEQADLVKKYLLSTVLSSVRRVKDGNEDSDDYSDNLCGRVVVRESTIPNGGLGLHVGTQGVKAGSLLGLYPGIIYRPSDLRHMADYPDITKHNEYLIWRYDGVVIDGKVAVESTAQGDEESVEEEEEEEDHHASQQHELVLHRYAHAHRANHPPRGSHPNSIPFMVNIPTTRDFAPLRSHIPNTLYPFSTPSAFDRLLNLGVRQRVPSTAAFQGGPQSLPCLALIATRDLCDEEVFMNYRYNPAAPSIPDWYHDCDPESTRRRWAGAGRILFST